MTIYNISNTTEWETTAGATIGSGDTVNLTAGLSFSANPTPIDINDGTFDGGNYTITMSGTVNRGILILAGGTIKNLIIDGGGLTYASSEGMVINRTTGGASQYGTIQTIKVSNATMGSFGGGIAGGSWGDVSNPSTINKCQATVTISSSWCGGIMGGWVRYSTITNCCYRGPTQQASATGGIVGIVASDMTITGCYNSVTNCYGGGIYATSDGNYTITISQCYVLGNHPNSGGGFIYRSESSTSPTITIENCYHGGNVQYFYVGGFINTLYGGSLTINDCYRSGTTDTGSGYIASQNSGTITTNDLVIRSTSAGSRRLGSVPTENNTSFTIGDVENGSLPAAWDTDVWETDSGAGAYALLTTFTNTAIWDGTYVDYNSTPEIFMGNTVTYSSITIYVGVTMNNNEPTVGGDTPSAYSISPSVPDGLSFNTTTGVLSGTPTGTQGATTYTVTFTIDGSDDTTEFTITSLTKPTASYTNPSAYTVGVAISTLSPSTTGTISSWSVSPSLPSGLSLNTSTGDITGTPSAETATATYTITYNFGSYSDTTTVSLTVNPDVPEDPVCLEGSALILTPKGYVPIKSCRVGMVVITGDGRESKIIDAHSFWYQGYIYMMPAKSMNKGKPLHNVYLTGDHKYKKGQGKSWLRPDETLPEIGLSEPMKLYHLKLEKAEDTLMVDGIEMEAWDHGLYSSRHQHNPNLLKLLEEQFILDDMY